PDRGRAVGHEQQAGELLGQPVVALVLADDPDQLGHDREHRHAEDERREHQVYLGRDPHGRAAADHGELAVLAHGLLREQRVGGQNEERERADRAEEVVGRGPVRHAWLAGVGGSETSPPVDTGPGRRKKGIRFEKSTGRLRRTSSITAGVISAYPRCRAHASTRAVTTPRTKLGTRSSRCRAAGAQAMVAGAAMPYVTSRCRSMTGASPGGS